MTLLASILLIVFSHLSYNVISNDNDKYFSPVFLNFEINFLSPAEESSEKSISFYNADQEKEINSELNILKDTKKIVDQNLYTSFIYRLLPFLIDEPPPGCSKMVI